jgi:hypothetical protein
MKQWRADQAQAALIDRKRKQKRKRAKRAKKIRKKKLLENHK